MRNLRNSFPEWSEKQIRYTARCFYRHFCDSFVESAAFPFLNEKESIKRFTLKNPEMVNDLFSIGKSIVLLMAHYGNWELSATCPLFVKHKVLAIYKPLKNKYFDRMFIKARERFGVKTVPMNKILRRLADSEGKGEKTMTYFLADQRPPWAQIQYWTKFLNQDTPVILGPEKIAGKFDMAVVFLKIIPARRGHYNAEFVLISENPHEMKELEITDLYFDALEKTIKDSPCYWLWTHKRWKHDKNRFNSMKTDH